MVLFFPLNEPGIALSSSLHGRNEDVLQRWFNDRHAAEADAGFAKLGFDQVFLLANVGGDEMYQGAVQLDLIQGECVS